MTQNVTSWKPGQSGNPAGRPKGSRDALTKDFIDAFATDFRDHGAKTIEKLRESDPRAYLQLASHLVPKEAAIKVAHRDETSDAFLQLLEGMNKKDAKIIEGEVVETSLPSPDTPYST